MINKSGPDYFFQGFNLIKRKGVRHFVIIPLLVNILLFGSAFYYLFGQIDVLVQYVIDWIPDWMSWLKDSISYFLWPFAVLVILLVSAYFFSTLANWIAAPFNGLLAERVEILLSGETPPSGSVFDLLKDVPRTFAREFIKLKYYIPRALGYLIIFFLLPVFGQVVWFLFTAWMMAIQYCDYPFDNHKVPFNQMRDHLLQNKTQSFGFGATVTVFSMIPIINLLVMPVAICGATAMWVDQKKELLEGSVRD